MESLTTERLEDYDFQRVNSILKNYNLESANKVYVVLSEQISSFGMFITLRVETEWNKPKCDKNKREKLISVSINNPSSHISSKNKIPVNVTEFLVKRGNTKLETAGISITDEELIIEVESKELNGISGKIEIEVLTPSLYSIIPSKLIPIYLFNFNLIFHTGSSKTLFFLDHSSEISLRSRRDNSEYQSLAYSFNDLDIRKITFFPEKKIEVSYVFGKSNILEYIKIGAPLLAGGISILAGALTIQFVKAKLDDIAATTFAIMVLPPFLQIFSSRKIFYSSSDINRLTFGSITLYTVAIVYLICLILTIGALLTSLYPFSLFEAYITSIYHFDLIIGVLLIILMILYLFFLNAGIFHNYMCDGCGVRIWLRKTAKLDNRTRKTLCNMCWYKASASYTIEGK